MEALPAVLSEQFGDNLQDVIARLGDISLLVSEAQVFSQIARAG